MASTKPRWVIGRSMGTLVLGSSALGQTDPPAMLFDDSAEHLGRAYDVGVEWRWNG